MLPKRAELNHEVQPISLEFGDSWELGMNVQTLAQVAFWVSAAALAYVYFGYPLALLLFTRRAKKSRATAPPSDPNVTLLISAYNEAKVISAKLENALRLEYPRELLQIIVISDSSDDGTDEIVSRYTDRGVQLVRQEERLGKSAGLNLGVRSATGEILIFSDANALYEPDAIRQLVKHFADPRVGYVVGNARYVEKISLNSAAEAEGLYWKLETWLKKKESLFHSVIGGDGAIYAIRRDLYFPLLPTDINDFLNPLQIIARGFIGVFEPKAISYEETAESFRKEYRRKVRIVSRSLNALRRVPGILNPFVEPRHWFSLVSHKLLRWWAPAFMLILFFSALIEWKLPLFRLAFLLQTAFYLMAVIGWLTRNKTKGWRVFSLPYYFCLVNLASLIGCIKCLRGDLLAAWTPPRQKEAVKV
jgi:cellulose synthase/poly-beta-1,6-N-acetylglucosamine synthase-like glycosyltransferase